MNKVVFAHAEAIPISTVPSATSVDPFALNEAGAREILSANKWPIGLQDTFINNLSLIPIRFFICDDSGSMMASDGHKLMVNSSMQHK